MTTFNDSVHVNGDLDCNHILPRSPIQIQQGGRLLSGPGVPSAAQGVNGDLYLRSASPGGATHLYYKASGTWTGLV